MRGRPLRISRRWLLAAVLLAGTARAEDPGAPRPSSAANPARAAAEAEYERRFIGFERVIYYRTPRSGGPGAKLELATRWGAAYQGSAQRALAPRELFEIVGRPDLARGVESRTTTQRVLRGTGAGLLAVGLGLSIGGGLAGVVHPTCWEQDIAGTCLDADRSPNGALLGVGVVAGVAGIVELVVAATRPIEPVGPSEIHKLALAYNEKLRADLGLPPRADTRYPDATDLPPSVDTGSLPPPPPPPPEEPKPEPPQSRDVDRAVNRIERDPAAAH